MGLLDNLNFSQPFRISSLLPSEAQLQAFKDKSDAEAVAQFSQDTNPIRRGAFNLLTALGVNPTIAQAAPTTADVLPGIGDISALADARTAFGQGDLATAGLLTAATLLPGVPAGKVKGLLKKSDDTKPLLNVDTAPTEGIANVVPPTDTDSGIIAFHGSGADFDQFKLSKIGTGEGAQAFGKGLYFTDSEDIAKFYKDTTTEVPYDYQLDGQSVSKLYNDALNNQNYQLAEVLEQVQLHDSPKELAERFSVKNGYPKETEEFVNGLNYERITAVDFDGNDVPLGKTYKVALAPKPDELLDFDLPLSEQSDFIKNNPLIKKLIKGDEDYRKRYPFSPIGERRGGNVLTTVSESDLNASGIKGIKYKAGRLSGFEDSDATNFVIFDENLINILAKYGIVGSVGITALQNSDI